MDRKILIVDDEKNIVEIIAFNLKKEGYQVIKAGDGEEGVKMAMEENPDLILLDIMMPKMDGYEACKKGIRTYYANAPKLMGTLKVAKVKGTLESELKRIERSTLLILDDLFLVNLDAKERPILLDIIEDRHGRKSIIITSQLPTDNWYDAIGDPTVADAIMDRIIHTAHRIELTGESVRKMAAYRGK